MIVSGEDLVEQEHGGDVPRGEHGGEGGELERGDEGVGNEADLLVDEAAGLAEGGREDRGDAGGVERGGAEVGELEALLREGAEDGAGEDDEHGQTDVEVHLPLDEGEDADEAEGCPALGGGAVC